MSQQYFRIWL